MKIDKAILFILIALQLTSCKKNWFDTTVEGRVCGYISNKPVADALITIEGTCGSDFNGNPITKVLYETQTDADGYYKYKFRDDGECGLQVRAFKSGYINDMTGVPSKQSIGSRGGKTYSNDLFLQEIAYFDLKLTCGSDCEYYKYIFLSGYVYDDSKKSRLKGYTKDTLFRSIQVPAGNGISLTLNAYVSRYTKYPDVSINTILEKDVYVTFTPPPPGQTTLVEMTY